MARTLNIFFFLDSYHGYTLSVNLVYMKGEGGDKINPDPNSNPNPNPISNPNPNPNSNPNPNPNPNSNPNPNLS